MRTIAATTAPALLEQTHNRVGLRAQSRLAAALSIVLLAGLASGVEAADEVQLIDQDLALAGGVTPGDLPGFPVEISRPGSYRLSGNLRVSVPGVHPIIIRADNVTIDLNGFTIQGPYDQCFRRLIPTWCMIAPALGNGVAVLADDDRSNVTIRNGTVRAMLSAGVWVKGLNSRVERLTVTQNGGDGIVVHEGVVSNNIVTYNKGMGIYGGFESGDMTAGKVYAVGNLLQSNAGGGVHSVVARDNVFHNNNGFGPQMLSGTLDAGGNICASGTC